MTFRYPLVAMFALAGQVDAAEGMWQPQELPAIEESLRSAGIEVDPRELADPQRYPLNALVELGDHCTAALISPLGLLLANRHCVLDALRTHALPGSDPVRDGMLARTLGEELPGAPAIRLTVSVQDVSAQIDAGPGAHGDREHPDSIERRKQRLLAACASVPGHRCRIHSVSGGTGYRLVRQLEIPDVRLAYVPAAAAGAVDGSAGSAGALRQHGDLALLRAYVGPDGQPAGASELNVPMRPRSHLKTQPAGLASGDFAMAVGYAGAAVGSAGALQLSFGRVRAVAASTASGPLPVDFLVDFDVAASSGSPLLNARAELVGIAFAGRSATDVADANSESTPPRGSAVDIRHLLRLLDATDDGDRLRRELVAEPAVGDAQR